MPRKTAAAAETAAPAEQETTAPAAETAAPAAAFTFGDAPVPETTRTSTVVNPLLDVCKSVKETMKDGRSTVAKTVQSASADQTKKIKRWLALAGQDLGVTFRSIEKDGVLTFWAVTRIEHKKGKNGNGKPAETAAPTA